MIASIRRFDQVMRRFRDDRRGLAAVEFALIVPLMLMMVFGTIEITNGIAVKRKIDLVSRTLSDLTSRASTLSSTDVTSFFTVGSAIMQPYGSSLAATISEVHGVECVWRDETREGGTGREGDENAGRRACVAGETRGESASR